MPLAATGSLGGWPSPSANAWNAGRRGRWQVLIALFLLSLSGGLFGSDMDGTELAGLRIPLLRDGALWVELRAEKATNASLEKADLTGVTIRVFDQLPPGQTKPPLKYLIESETGTYSQQAGMAVLVGRVVVTQYAEATGDGGAAVRVPQTRLACERAEWRDAVGQLVAPGKVTITHPNGDALTGEDLVYTLGEGRGEDARSAVAMLKRNVSMRILDHRAVAASRVAEVVPETRQRKPAPTSIACRGTAWYEFDGGTVRFADAVEVTHGDDVMRSDRLKVVLGGSSTVTRLHAQGTVRIEGQQRGASGVVYPFSAEGEDAVFDSEKNILFLQGEGDTQPSVRYGDYWIQDERVAIHRNTGVLTAAGQAREFGLAVLRAAMADQADAGKAGASSAPVTRIRYGRSLHHDRYAGTARFDGGVDLRHPQMTLTSQVVEVRTPETDGRGEGEALNSLRRIRRVTASQRVSIVTRDGRRARAEQAVFDTLGNSLILSGPPDPVIEQDRVFRIQAPHITSKTLPDETGEERRLQHVRADGPGTMKLLVEERSGAAAGEGMWEAERATLVRFGRGGGMTYNALTQRAVFNREVVLTRGELVLNAAQLEVLLHEQGAAASRSGGGDANGDVLEEAGLRVRKLIARGTVELHARGGRHSACASMTYDVDTRVVTLLGADMVRARVWAEAGSELRAERIVDRSGEHRIEADGPGDLTLAEPGALGVLARSARIAFAGRLVYTAVPDTPAKAVFHRDVRLHWQDMIVTGDRLDAELGEAADVSQALAAESALAEGRDPQLLKRGLEAAVVTGHVEMQGGRRRAWGEQALVLRVNSSITLSSKSKPAEFVDDQGLRLSAPQFVLYRRQAVMKATGPGTLFVAATATERAGLPRRSVRGDGGRSVDCLPGEHPFDYALRYQTQMIYDLSQRRLLFEGGVNLQQVTLNMQCQAVEVLLRVDPSRRRSADPETQGLTVATIICRKDVRIRRYEPPGADESLEDVLASGATTTRPGTSVIVECSEALFDAARNEVVFSGDEKKAARFLEQEVSKRGEVVSRTLYHNVGKAILDRNTGDVSFPFDKRGRNARVKPLSTEGPLAFPD